MLGFGLELDSVEYLLGLFMELPYKKYLKLSPRTKTVANIKRVERIKIGTGVLELKLSHCKWFDYLLETQLLEHTNYIFRGHADASWLLEPTLDRIVKKQNSPKREAHLQRFKYSTRGRRGASPPALQEDNDWWALGQHHGLATPLLDWTESPFVALYFAASTAYESGTKRMAVWGLSKGSVSSISKKIGEDPLVEKINGRIPTVKLFSPLSDENSRLVSQRGLFTRGPNNMDLGTWIQKYYDGKKYPLLKITMPTTGIQDRLRTLNRMNINFSSLFPDISGACNHCNRELKISKY